jgi:hypothetical protein
MAGCGPRIGSKPGTGDLLPVWYLALLFILVGASASFNAQGSDLKNRTCELRRGNTVIRIEYGTVSARGRRIFGALVPYGVLWKFGATVPTTIETTVDLRIGQETIAAGKYRLFATPYLDKWQIVFNASTDACCVSEHDNSQDVASISASVVARKAPVEELDIVLVESASDNNKLILRVAWERVQVDLPIEVQTIRPGL